MRICGLGEFARYKSPYYYYYVDQTAGSYQQPAPLTNFSQYASSPGRRAAHYYARLAVSSPAVAGPIPSTALTALMHGGIARLSKPA